MNLSYPKSFPNKQEELFLKLILSEDKDFPKLFESWKQVTPFDGIDSAMLHLLPLAHIRMKNLGMQEDSLYGKIKGIYKNAWVRNQQLIGVTRNIALECANRGIPMMMLKGLALMLDIYQDPGARFTGDADIAIPPEYAKQAISMMLDIGWKYRKPWMPDVNNPSESLYFVSKSTDFDKRQGTAIDLHWNIFGLYHHAKKLDILLLRDTISSICYRKVFWESAVPISKEDFPALRLSNEDLLIHVIIHGEEDALDRPLRWVTDAATIIKKFPIKWDLVVHRCEKFDFTIEILLGLRYLKENIGLPIPPETLTALSKIGTQPHQIKEFYQRGTIFGSDRFSPLNNLLMLWYAYWKYEPRGKFPKTIFGYVRFTFRSLGISNPKMFLFVLVKYFKKLWRQLTKTF